MGPFVPFAFELSLIFLAAIILLPIVLVLVSKALCRSCRHHFRRPNSSLCVTCYNSFDPFEESTKYSSPYDLGS